MTFQETRLAGATVIELQSHADERGSFARTMCRREFAAAELPADFVQTSISRNLHAGTVRGLHFQRPPHAEAKLVHCIVGAIWDVIVDLRESSPTYLGWEAFELEARRDRLLYVPKGFAHGYQTLVPGSEVLYQISTCYVPEAAGGVRHDDPALAIKWPLPVAWLSAKDASWPLIAGAWSTPFRPDAAFARGVAHDHH